MLFVFLLRLTYSEALGDIICEHGDRKPYMADACLALAHIIYKSCGVLRKAALSMCKRGMTNGVIEFIYQNKDFTAGEDREHTHTSTHILICTVPHK